MEKCRREQDHLGANFHNLSIQQKKPSKLEKSSTILIYKKGDRQESSNWRPISLQSTIYKIYTAILARRLAEWAICEKKLSLAQKGFLPYKGCFEHSFLLRSVIEDSKRLCKNVRIVWLDLKNAFGSVPHRKIWEMMSQLGVPANFLEICREIYTNSTHKVRNKEGLSDDIPVYRGIKQGCPWSPLLFNLVLEGIIPQIENSDGGYQFKGGCCVKILVYADDICLIGQEKEDIQRSLDMLTKFTNWAGLTIKISKCGSLSLINNKGRKYVEPYQPCIGQVPIPALKWSDSYKYLGIKTSREQQEKHRRYVRSIWNLVQKSLKRLNSAIVIEDSEISLEVGDLTIEAVHRKEVLKILSEEIHLFI